MCMVDCIFERQNLTVDSTNKMGLMRLKSLRNYVNQSVWDFDHVRESENENDSETRSVVN